MNDFRLQVKNAVLSITFLVMLVACSALPKPTPITKIASTTAVTYTVKSAVTHSKVKLTPTLTPIVDEWCDQDQICIRWFIGIGGGTNPNQIDIEEDVVRDFHRFSEPQKIHLFLEIVPFSAAKDALETEFAADNGPDIVGPMNWHQVTAYGSHWLDLKPYLAANPQLTTDINPTLLDTYNTPKGQIGFPFAVYPSAIFYNTALFDAAGLAYPPSSYSPNLRPATYQLDGKNVEWNWDTIREVGRRLTVDANGKNATEAGFDKTKIVQYGFSWNFQAGPSYIGAFWGNGSYSADGKTAELPAPWKAAWAWTYDGISGEEPFIPNSETSASETFEKGNPFNSGKVAMTEQPSWYICCMDKVQTWELGVLPAYNGKVAGRMDVDFFALLDDKSQYRHPDQAFQALSYLTTTAIPKLLIGSPRIPPPVSNGMPAHGAYQADWLNMQKTRFPWVKHWDILITDLSFADSPNTESDLPNYTKITERNQRFYNMLASTSGLDLEQQEAIFLADLQKLLDEENH